MCRPLASRGYDDVTEQAPSGVLSESSPIWGAGSHALRVTGDRRHIGGMVDANPDQDARADARAAAFKKAVANERNRVHEGPSHRSWISRLIKAFKRIVGAAEADRCSGDGVQEVGAAADQRLRIRPPANSAVVSVSTSFSMISQPCEAAYEQAILKSGIFQSPTWVSVDDPSGSSASVPAYLRIACRQLLRYIGETIIAAQATVELHDVVSFFGPWSAEDFPQSISAVPMPERRDTDRASCAKQAATARTLLRLSICHSTMQTTERSSASVWSCRKAARTT